MQKINWGIIGCGDVTELKSGPAFNKVPNSALVAVMRRNAEKAADYAKRHSVTRWYSNANDLINDPEVNAVYIATPPALHEEYTLAALHAGKPVYVEKPMALDYASAKRMQNAARQNQVKLVVAHYRREWPLFKKLKQLVDEKSIGDIFSINLVYDKIPLTHDELKNEKIAWRVDPAVSGGGLFHDLAPHQLDILYFLFGDAAEVVGTALNKGKQYAAADHVTGLIKFKNGPLFHGTWNFYAEATEDLCEIIGTGGTLRFSFFGGNAIELTQQNKTTTFSFDTLLHVQQPMIERTVQYFLGNATNPCPAGDGAIIMHWMDEITSCKIN